MVNNFHTIRSGIVRDALYCMAEKPLDNSYIGGGLSLQLTLPEELHRITCDIDLTTSKQTTAGDYRTYVNDAFGTLLKRGYSLNVEKSRNTLDAHLEREEEHLMVQLPRRSEKNFRERKAILEREVENARAISYVDHILRVIAYEDLVAHKLIRSTTFLDYYGLKLPRKKALGEMKVELDVLKEHFDRNHFSLSPEDAARDLASIRLYADLFDITAVLIFFPNEFDETYFLTAINSFEAGKEKSEKWRKIFERIS